MNTKNRSILISAVVLLLVACICAGTLAVGGTGAAILAGIRANTVGTAPTPVIEAITQPVELPTATQELGASTPPPEITPTPVGAVPSQIPDTGSTPGAISADVAAQMDQIQQQVIQLRGLQPKSPVQRALLTRDQLKVKVSQDFFKDYTQQDANNDATMLAAFGLLPPNFNLMDLYTRLYSEDILGYYDNQTKQMYVVQGQSFQGPERLTYSHEYTHALQDQNFDLRNGVGFNPQKCKQNSDACGGIQALIEGDATLSEIDWLRTDATQQDQQQIQQDQQNQSSPVLDAAPAFIQQDLAFPYRNGEQFVQALFTRGGWDAVNAAFKDPPTSTAQILHPDRYPQVKPAAVTLPDLSKPLGSAWHHVQTDTLGEWYTFLTLAYGDNPQARLPESDAFTATDGWAGDRYEVYANSSNQPLALLITSWDNAQHASGFRDAILRYGQGRWGSPAAQQPDHLSWQTSSNVVDLRVKGNQTIWVIAPDAASAQAVVSAVQ